MNRNVKKIDFVDPYNRWLLISGYNRNRKTARIKNILKKRGNCYFASGVSGEITDFAFRAVKKLSLTGTNFFFSKGAVRKKGNSLSFACCIEKIDWDIGISVKIPRLLNVRSVKKFRIAGVIYEIRVMEILILGALLKIRYPNRRNNWYSETAVLIISKGWVVLDNSDKADILVEI